MPPSPGDDEQVGAALHELLSMADHEIRTVTADPALALTHAWFVRCVDTIKGALALDERGYANVASPLVRMAMELAVGMVWLNKLGPDAVLAVGRSHKRWAANLRRAITEANAHERELGRGEWPPELDAVFDAIDEEEIPEGSVDGERRTDVRFQVAKEFNLYVAWLSETAASHASEACAHQYLVAEPNRYRLLRSPREPGTTLELRCGVVAVVAFRAMGTAIGSDVWQAKVDRFDDQLTRAYQQARAAGLLDPPTSNDR